MESLELKLGCDFIYRVKEKLKIEKNGGQVQEEGFRPENPIDDPVCDPPDAPTSAQALRSPALRPSRPLRTRLTRVVEHPFVIRTDPIFVHPSRGHASHYSPHRLVSEQPMRSPACLTRPILACGMLHACARPCRPRFDPVPLTRAPGVFLSWFKPKCWVLEPVGSVDFFVVFSANSSFWGGLMYFTKLLL